MSSNLGQHDQPEWLNQLKNDLIDITTQAARSHWPGSSPEHEPYFNYRLEHVRQVERDALRLLSEVGADRNIVLAGVWIHDRFQPQYRGGEQHALRAAEWAAENLAALGFPTTKIDRVVKAVACHSSEPGAIPPQEVEARLLWDADKLSKLGALQVVAFLGGMPAFPEKKMSYKEVAQLGLENLERIKTLADQFYFATSQRWALQRYETMATFYEGLAGEVGEEEQNKNP